MNTTARPITPYVVGLLITLVVIFVLYLAFFVPKLDASAAVKAEVAKTQTSNTTLAARVAQVEQNKKDTPAQSLKIAEFSKTVPQSAAQKSLMDDIIKAAADSGATLTGLNPALPSAASVVVEAVVPAPSPAAAASDDAALESVQLSTEAEQGEAESEVLAAVAVTLNAAGTRANLEAFTDKLEGLTRPLKFSSISIDGEGSAVNMSLTAQSFYMAPLVDPLKTVAAEDPATKG